MPCHSDGFFRHPKMMALLACIASTLLLASCLEPIEEMPAQDQPETDASPVDPSGEPIMGETLTFTSCLEPDAPERHGVNFIIGGLSAGRNNGGTPHAPRCDQLITGRFLRVFLRDDDFLRSPVGTWNYTQFEEDGRIYRTDEQYGSVYLHHLDTHFTHTPRILVPGVSLSLTISTWNGDDMSSGSWNLQGADYYDKLGETIRGDFRVELIDGTVHEGVIEGIWCGGSPYCEED